MAFTKGCEASSRALIDRRAALGLLGGASVAAALGTPLPAFAAEPLKIVATTGMIADAARRIGGERATVAALMGPGVDPHAYRQTRTDILAFSRADLVLWNGHYLEAQMEEFLLDLAQRRKVVAVSETLPVEQLLAHEDYADRFDPHVWMDPSLWAAVVEAVRDAMIDAAPADAELFKANGDLYLAELRELATYSTSVLESVPAESRVLLSAHDAFNYFGRAYGYEVLGIQGISTEAEAGLRRIEELTNLLVERRVKAVFVESSVSDRNVKALIEGAAAQGWSVSIGGELYSDAMGEPSSYRGTYVGMIDHNVTTIARALGGSAPEGGMQGRLVLAGAVQ